MLSCSYTLNCFIDDIYNKQNILAAGIVPAGLELMDNAATRASESFVHAGYPLDAAAILLCEVDGFRVLCLACHHDKTHNQTENALFPRS